MQRQDIKKIICESTILQDQERVAKQWANTFFYNSKDDVATNMARMLVACVAMSDFKTKSEFDEEYLAPSDKLTIADYVSHASRIIIDYEALSDANKTELLQCFNKQVGISRAATHDVKRKASGDVVEGKGMLIGMRGAVGVTANDFGINIAMGGENQLDFNDQPISANGYCGHFYYHINNDAQALLCGLEQSGPAVGWLDVFTHAVVGAHADQFGQTHSLAGLSDTYTAAGSLYFSDPIYQAKLMLECGVLPPAKYNGMHVKLTDENWLQVKDFLEKLNQLDNPESVTKVLLNKPAVTSEAKPIKSYMEFQFENYIKRNFDMWIRSDTNINEATKQQILDWQNKLLLIIRNSDIDITQKQETLQHAFDQYAHELVGKDNHYFIAMKRVLHLVRNQAHLKLQENEKFIHEQHLSGLYDGLQEDMRQLLNDAQVIRGFYSSQFIDPADEHVSQFLRDLQGIMVGLTDNLDNSSDDLMSSSITSSFEMVNAHLSDERIRELSELVNSAKLFLNKPPTLRVALMQVPQPENVLQINPVKSNHFKTVMPVLEAIANMGALASSLSSKGKNIAAEQALAVVSELEQAVRVYISEPIDDNNSLQKFKLACHASLTTQRDELYSYADARRIRNNVFLALGLLGVGYLIAIVLNKAITGNFLFFNSTSRDAIAKKVDEIEDKGQDKKNQPGG